MKRLGVIVALLVVALCVGAAESAGGYDVERSEESADYLLDRIEEIVYATNASHGSRADYRGARDRGGVVDGARGERVQSIRRRP